jgi:Predicted membrane protein
MLGEYFFQMSGILKLRTRTEVFMKTGTKNLVLTAILIAIMLLFGFTPIGYIPIGPVQITLMCLPVIIGTLILGLRTGMILGFVFALTSLAQLLMGTSVLFNLLIPNLTFGLDFIKILLIIFIPRLLIAPLVFLAYKAIRLKKEKLRIGIVSALGSLVNTVLFLLMLYAFFANQIGDLLLGGKVSANIEAFNTSAWTFILSVGLLNGLPEAAFAVVVCIPVIMALRKTYKQKTIGETGE